ncbi:MAG TPA: CoA transferase, partial [Candidatus Binatia bacterium]|nr:CoA transferase [Candidatus Binatia bacterium]
GNRHPATAPCNSFLCKDGYVILAIAHDKQWASLCRIIGHEELINDPRTATVAARKENETLVEQVTATWISTRTKQEVVSILNAASISTSPVMDFGEIVREPHFREREIVCEVEHPAAGKLTHYGVGPKFSRTPARVRAAAPVLGQDNAVIYGKWLGYSETELEELRGRGVI